MKNPVCIVCRRRFTPQSLVHVYCTAPECQRIKFKRAKTRYRRKLAERMAREQK